MNKFVFVILLLLLAGCSGGGRDFNAVDHRESADPSELTLTGDEFIACQKPPYSCVTTCWDAPRSCIKVSHGPVEVEPVFGKNGYRFTFRNDCKKRILIRPCFETRGGREKAYCPGDGDEKSLNDGKLILSPGEATTQIFTNTWTITKNTITGRKYVGRNIAITGRFSLQLAGSHPGKDWVCISRNPNFYDNPFE